MSELNALEMQSYFSLITNDTINILGSQLQPTKTHDHTVLTVGQISSKRRFVN